LRSRMGETAFYHVDKKRREAWQAVKETQKLATDGAMFANAEAVDLRVYAPFDWPGISMHGLKQKVAQAAIREAKAKQSRGRKETNANIDQIKKDLRMYCGHVPTTTQIWRGLRSKDLSRQVKNFLWKAVHGAHKIGNYFRKMPSPWKEMAECPTCKTTETMEHILLDCPDSRQDLIWSLVKEHFEMR
ncbi:hypothetical protein AURDEDRAFT_22438, partial [Auricularia subglabra TFB-10046 SS5]